MLEQARCFPEMIDMYKQVKAKNGLRVVVVSNEGRELTADRIRRFKLKEFVDIFVVSSYVHFRKPDEDIFRIALDVAQAEPGQVVYVDDRHMFAEVASRLGMREIWHRDYASTREALAGMGLDVGNEETR
jgi:putative hydrolase of the HAD superfamily